MTTSLPSCAASVWMPRTICEKNGSDTSLTITPTTIEVLAASALACPLTTYFNSRTARVTRSRVLADTG